MAFVPQNLIYQKDAFRMLADYFKTSLESIDHQYDGLLIKDLTVAVKKLREPQGGDIGDNLVAFKRSAEKIVLNRTGINISLTISPDLIANAWVYPPQIDRNHPLLTDFHRQVYQTDGIKKVKDKKTVLSGTVDRKRAKVSGVFSDIIVKTVLTTALLTGDKFTADEVAAVLIHELGHVFTYYEYLGTGITTNYVLSEVTKRLAQTSEQKRRYQIIKEGCKALDIDLDDPDALTATNNDVVIQTVILRKAMEKRVSELESPTYDLTAWEMMSDQFVSRHGGGRSLVTGLDKIIRQSPDSSYMSGWQHHAIEVLKLILVLGTFMIFAPIILFLLMGFVDTNENLYDKSKARMERIRRDMVDSLKDRNLDRDITRKITEDIEVIDTLLSEMEDRRTYLQFFWSTFRKKGRSNHQQMKFQQELEILANNELFTRAAKLRTIKL